jgi:hypothetical protein
MQLTRQARIFGTQLARLCVEGEQAMPRPQGKENDFASEVSAVALPMATHCESRPRARFARQVNP